jgi:F-box/WD-40 domain protein 10
VKIPNLYPESDDFVLQDDENQLDQKTKRDYNWKNAYSGISTRNIMMEERNVFCTSYNVLLLKEFRDPHRVAHLHGESTVALGSFNKKIRFIDTRTATEKPMYIMHGNCFF